MSQYGLLDIIEEKLHSRTLDPQTSKKAAREVEFTRQQQQVYDALVKFDRPQGLTPKELAALSGIDYYTISRRMNELYIKCKVIVLKDIERECCRVWRAI